MTAWDRAEKRTETLGVKVGRSVALPLRAFAKLRGVPLSDLLREALAEKVEREAAALLPPEGERS